MKFLNSVPSYDLTYSDVFMVPQPANIDSRFDVDLTTPDGIGTNIPLVVSNMTAVAGKRMAETVARRGGVVTLPQDIPLDSLERMITYVKACHPIYETPISCTADTRIFEALHLLLKRSHGAAVVVDDDNKPIGIFTEDDAEGYDRFTAISKVMAKKVITIPDGTDPEQVFEYLEHERLNMAPIVNTSGRLIGVMTKKGALRSCLYKPAVDKQGRLLVAVAIGINGNVAERALRVLDMGADILVLDTAHGHQAKMINAVKAVSESIHGVPIVAGNVVTAEATRDLIQAGATIVKVGVGPGAMCTTRIMTGVGRPQFSAVLECAAEAKQHGAHIWADGGIKHPRDIALALAAGASNVMFGSWLAPTYESAGDMLVDDQGRKYKENFGMASQRAVRNRNRQQKALDRARKEFFEEGISTSKNYIDPLRPGTEDIIDHFTAGVRSACTYAGARSFDELHQRAVIGIQSAAGYQEGLPVPSGW